MRCNNLFISFLYSIAIKVDRFTLKVINYIDRIREKENNKKWNDFFNGCDKIIFSKNTIKLNLYKDSILSKFIYDGFERNELEFMLSKLNSGDVFIDVGSNIGLFSILASKKVGANGKVVCFEPSPITYKRLIENIELNDFHNIEARNIGLSDNEGELIFYFSNSGFDAWDSFAPNSRLKKSIVIKTSTLDIQLDNIDKSTVKFIKIDVEGWEKFVIKGGENFFKNYAPIVMVEFTEENTFNAGYPIHDIFKEFECLGYEWYCIENGDLVKETKKMNYKYANLIAMKNV